MKQSVIVNLEDITFKSQEKQDLYDSEVKVHQIVETIYNSTKKLLPSMQSITQVNELRKSLLKMGRYLKVIRKV